MGTRRSSEADQQAGLRAFIDFRDFRPGAPSIKEMERGVTTCRKTLLVLTPAYIESEWCELEGIMLQTLSPTNRDFRLIPLLRVPCKKPLRIGTLTHIDYTDTADMDLAASRLLAALDTPAELPEQNGIPPNIQEELDRAKSFTDADKYSDAIPVGTDPSCQTTRVIRWPESRFACAWPMRSTKPARIPQRQKGTSGYAPRWFRSAIWTSNRMFFTVWER